MTENSRLSSNSAAQVGVSLRGARLIFDQRAVFENLSLELEAGRTTCLLGPSGIGKSSLLRLLAGIGRTATCDDLAASDGVPLAGRIAYMDQRDLLYPWLDVLDNVTLGSRLRGDKPDTARAMALLDDVGLGGQGTASIDTLSGGMRQRVALVRTLMEDQPIILMDEPFSGLDALNRFKLQDLAVRLLDGRTVLLVTHDAMEALRLGHVIYLLDGAPAELSSPIRPAGPRSRAPHDATLLAEMADLLRQLGLSGTEAAC